jgi:2-aminoadipate transaminase
MTQFADRLNGVTGSEIRRIFSLLGDPEIISLAGGNPSPLAFPGEDLADLSRELISCDCGTVLQMAKPRATGACSRFSAKKTPA